MAQLADWLAQHGLGKYAELLAHHEVELDVLPDLSEQDLAWAP